ncbi:MAG: hypothetical protein JEZ00_15975 [Anaerolineaceae bacterium]|nr:hypothetical protein [Anaerolineaceae bacterium]
MFPYQKTINRLTIIIIVLSVVAVLGAFFFPYAGQSYSFETLRGEEVSIYGSGLYRYETVSFYSQAIAQDIVTLILGVPLLIVSMLMAAKGSMRGRVLLTGTLAYFLYTYASYSFLSAFNEFYLIYVALFSMSLFAVTLSFMSIKPDELAEHIKETYPRKGLAIFCLSVGGVIALMWLGRILPAIFQDTAPVGLEAAATLVIQSLDLGLIVPLGILAGVLLLRKQNWGYLLGSVFLFKGTTLVIAVFVMALNMQRMGVSTSMVETGIFAVITGLAILFTAKVIRSIE